MKEVILEYINIRQFFFKKAFELKRKFDDLIFVTIKHENVIIDKPKYYKICISVNGSPELEVLHIEIMHESNSLKINHIGYPLIETPFIRFDKEILTIIDNKINVIFNNDAFLTKITNFIFQNSNSLQLNLLENVVNKIF